MYRITQCLSVGPFASADWASELLAAGVTHVLNVSDGPSHISPADGFVDVAWVPMYDDRRLPRDVARQAIQTLHEFASAPGAHVYVHCVAGLVRSPTILWLYLIALGVPAKDARTLIEQRNPRANAGAARMVNHEYVTFAQMHGLMHFLPLARPELIAPFPLAEEG